MATYGVVTAAAGVAGSFIVPYVIKPFGTKTTFLLGAAGFVTCLLITYIFLSDAEITFMIGMAVGMFFAAFCTTASFAMFANCVTYSAWKTGIAAGEFTMGMYSFPIKVSVLVSRIFIPAFLAAGGHQVIDTASGAVLVNEQTMLTYKNLVFLTPAAAIAVCALVLLFFFRLTEQRVASMQADLANGTAPFMTNR